MIAGNPNCGRTIAGIAIAILFIALLSAAWVGLRKKDEPEKEPPIHPAAYLR